jgi:hypothetical protein
MLRPAPTARQAAMQRMETIKAWVMAAESVRAPRTV